MGEAGKTCPFQRSPNAQQKHRQICFWEKQPSGCSRISCAFQHSKPRNRNGLFLPPDNNVPLQQGGQERTLHPAHLQESLRNQENISLPVHAPLIIRLNNAEDEQDDEEDDDKENYVSNWVPKTAAEIEEERTIKEICYKTGEYCRIQHPHKHPSTETASSAQEKEILLLEAMERDLQKGFNTSDPRGKPSYQPRSQRKDDEPASYVPRGRAAGRKTYCDSSEPRRSAYVFYRTVDVTQEPKFSGSTGDGNTCAALNNAKKGGESSGRRVPAERIPRSNWRSFDNGGIHSSDPNGKPSYQQRRKNKDDETASAVPYVRAASRKTDSDSLEPRRSTYVFYRTVNAAQEPKFSGSAAPEPYGGKCSKPKNQLDTNRGFSTQTESYGAGVRGRIASFGRSRELEETLQDYT